MFTLKHSTPRLSQKFALAVLLSCGVATSALAQTDPGVRGGAAGAGGPLIGLGGLDLQFFNIAARRFNEVDSVSGTIDDRTNTKTQVTGAGLGPAFNGTDCAECHAQPAVGGTGPAKNPQIRTATLDGAKNTIPPFITANGPTREARFKKTAAGAPDNGVHDLFVITGRSDAPGCTATQPNFPQAVANNNVSFRIPTPLFGLGLVENTPDTNLRADSAANASNDSTFGIVQGDFQLSGNDGTIMRFGWKAQNKSIAIFAGEAYNVEQGVTNDLFPTERVEQTNCIFNGLPEDLANEVANTQVAGVTFGASQFSSDVVNFTNFIRLSAAPVPVTPTSTTSEGETVFMEAGCGLCHIPTHVTGNSAYGNQSFVTYSPFSDFALHDMGTALQDGITQGSANGTQFRTAPLWGLGQRVFFLHDGRETNLINVLNDHLNNASESNTSEDSLAVNFSVSQQQDLVDFLRSL
ncbi:MAG: di-heme oxidoredictase family protein [Aliidongia sp.]